jgi:type I restriction enzyme S subunit
MDEGSTVKLGDVAHLGGGYAFKSEQYTDSGRFVLRTVNIRDDTSITKDGATFISEKEAVQFERFSLQEHDTLFVMVAATLGKIGYVRASDLPALLNQNMWVIRAKSDLVDPVFLHYLFRELSKIPLAWVGGSARSFLRRDDVRNLEFILPTRPTQQGIAETLKSLDDKIELNRRTNETLEALARAIFRDWFVDFGPTRAKAEGREPYLAPELWDLFPDRLDAEGKPEGWANASFGDTCERVAMGPFGSNIRKDNFIESGVPVVRGGNLKNGFVDDNFVYITDEKAESLRKSIAYPGDIVITHRGTLGQVGRIPKAARYNRYVVSQSQMLLGCGEGSSSSFLFEFLRSNTGQHALLANVSQTGVPAIARPTASVKAMRVILPGSRLLAVFDEVVGVIYDRSEHSDGESRTLAQTRDLLLPKLMSGEIRLKDAGKMAQALL